MSVTDMKHTIHRVDHSGYIMTVSRTQVIVRRVSIMNNMYDY